MDLVLDFLLLSASGAACLYCWVLNRRLKGLTSAKGGLGAGVAQLSQSAEEMKAALAATRSAADEAAARIESLLADADRKASALEELLDRLEKTGASVAEKAEDATQKYVDVIAPFLAEANAAADRLFAAIERSPAAEPDTPKNASTIPTEPVQNKEEDYVAIDAAPTKRAARPREARKEAAA
ncbi:hypothetical protein [Amphiplicatus metriothermophilus]|uniref:Uncharacterized protein n=1 Tax=Amphiplicatus metriothermophilus TaxID=1519374 RepID=A0A239PKK7_9PROT|nr:hypothetical protein [Amphiplicatus metriothermophilus]MBB5517312.1 chromosome segregation ATPase [Amphiplicatus metriothermophilus]SNT68352.1 hypothetical protein SAMN06297382_0854 [Amphiplicatus metriothermophilus]